MVKVGDCTVDNVLVMPKSKEVQDWLDLKGFEWKLDFEEKNIVHIQFKFDSELEEAKIFLIENGF